MAWRGSSTGPAVTRRPRRGSAAGRRSPRSAAGRSTSSLRKLTDLGGTLAAMNARTASWGRVAAGTVALFAIVLAFLAGKVKAGGDPTQASAPAPVVTT